MPICDMHLHTRLSEDASQDENNTVMSCCKAAVEKNIKHIALTDHRDLSMIEGSVNADISELGRQCNDAKRRFSGKLNVMFGAEIAHMHTYPEQAKVVMEENELDFVLGSLHKLKDGRDVYYMDFSEYSDEQLLVLYSDYLDEIIEIAQNCDFDSLAHITYPLRYYRKSGREKVVDLKQFYDKYDVIFDALIERKKALEINCSTYAESLYNQPMPTYELIERYIRRGGKLFTLGSDSHEYSRVGFGIENAQKFLNLCGVQTLCAFDKREMYFIPNVTE